MKKDESGRERLFKTDIKKQVTVPYLADYVPSRNTKIPFAYLITIKDPDIISLLKSHGIVIEELIEEKEFTVETYKINDLKPESRLNQGHYNNDVKGEFVKDTITFSAGTFVVRTTQSLANVAVLLLEPESKDGLLYWNFFDNYIVPQWGNRFLPYPVYKLNERKALPLKIIN